MVKVAVRQRGKRNIRANVAKLGLEKTKDIGVRRTKPRKHSAEVP